MSAAYGETEVLIEEREVMDLLGFGEELRSFYQNVENIRLSQLTQLTVRRVGSLFKKL